VYTEVNCWNLVAVNAFVLRGYLYLFENEIVCSFFHIDMCIYMCVCLERERISVCKFEQIFLPGKCSIYRFTRLNCNILSLWLKENKYSPSKKKNFANHIEQKLSWETDRHSAGQEILFVLWTQKFGTVFPRICHWSCPEPDEPNLYPHTLFLYLQY